VVPLQLIPGDDLRRALGAWMGEQQEHAGCVVISAVGSRLSVAQLRLAGAAEAASIRGSWRSTAWPAPSRPMAATGYAELAIKAQPER
jgi:hypothetical protein